MIGPRTVWTTGRITLDPGAPSIIPGHAEMLFQMRDDDPEVIARLEDALRNMAAEVTAQGRCTVAMERIRTGAPARMNSTFQRAIEAASAAYAGGRSILDAVQHGLALPPDALRFSRDVLREFGNMSSATLVFVLERILRSSHATGDGMAMAFGPGLTVETFTFHRP